LFASIAFKKEAVMDETTPIPELFQPYLSNIEHLLHLISIGMNLHDAALLARLWPSDVDYWQKRGEADIKAAKDTPHAWFALKVQQAAAHLMYVLLKTIHEAVVNPASKKNAHLAMEVLIRRFHPEEWAHLHLPAKEFHSDTQQCFQNAIYPESSDWEAIPDSDRAAREADTSPPAQELGTKAKNGR
jgi:hypothetical protein